VKNFLLKALYGVVGNVLALGAAGIQQGGWYQEGLPPIGQVLWSTVAVGIGTGLAATAKRLIGQGAREIKP